VFRREQLILEDNKVIRIEPHLGDDQIFLQKGDGPPEPFMQSVYDGTSKTQPASCYGSYTTALFSAVGLTFSGGGTALNTTPATILPVPFSIDKQSQTVRFSTPVTWQYQPPGLSGLSYYVAAQIVLETAVQILDPEDNGIVRYTRTLDLPGDAQGTPPLKIHREDVQANYIGSYDYTTWTLLRTDDDTDFAEQAADYYLATAAAQFEIIPGRNREYNGIVPIALDGSIAQISWEVGPGGAKTHTSLNGEHDLFFPTYPERQRLEYLAPPARDRADGDLSKIPPIHEPRGS
jgi:hypothetical protein